jgi:cytochrome P450
LSHPGKYLLEGYRRHGPVFRFWMWGHENVGMIGPEANELILVKERARFSHAEGYRSLAPVFSGNGLLFQDGPEHRRARALMMPAFHAQGVRRYFDVMHACVQSHVESWTRQRTGKMFQRFQALTFEVMARLILGVRGPIELGRLNRLNRRLARATISFPRIPWRFTPYGRGLAARAELERYLRGVLAERRADPGTDALGLLIAAREGGEALGEDELVDHALFLMFAGHETTTSMLTSTLLMLAREPWVLRRLQAEQRKVVGDGELTAEHIPQLVELDRTLKEVERRWPPVSLAVRQVAREVSFAGYTLPVGTNVLYSPWVTHHLEHVFADPERFDPDRFAPPRAEHRATPCALVGFGAGPRLCIGQAFAQLEMKITLSALLRRTRIVVKNTQPTLRYVPTLHPTDGLPARVERA